MGSNKLLSRRKFLAFMGAGAAAAAAAATGFGLPSKEAHAASEPKEGIHSFPTAPASFESRKTDDRLLLRQGFSYSVLCSYGDVINARGDTFGYNNSFAAFIPDESNGSKAVLWANHESCHEVWVQGRRQAGTYTGLQVEQLLYNQGGSVLELERSGNGEWKLVPHSTFSRRVSGLDPFIFTGPAKGTRAIKGVSITQGTFANRSGAKTPWGTILSVEGGFDETCRDAGLESTHYGWVTEIDPFDASFHPRKHTALGRLRHSRCAISVARDGRVVVYMGDARDGTGLFKFVSKGKFDASKGNENSVLLTEGALYAADVTSGQWIEISVEAVRSAIRSPFYKIPASVAHSKEQLLSMFQDTPDVYVFADIAALLLGATPTERIGDLQLHPTAPVLYIAHPQGRDSGNLHGQVNILYEKGGDLGADSFDMQQLLAGGRHTGFSSPDGLYITSRGRLFLSTNVEAEWLDKGAWSGFHSNGLYISEPGAEGARPALFASAPHDARFAGMCFTPDEKTMFLNVMHPGHCTVNAAKPTGSWPNVTGDGVPRPSLVAIRGF